VLLLIHKGYVKAEIDNIFGFRTADAVHQIGEIKQLDTLPPRKHRQALGDQQAPGSSNSAGLMSGVIEAVNDIAWDYRLFPVADVTGQAGASFASPVYRI